MTFVTVHAIADGSLLAGNLGAVSGLKSFNPSFVVRAMEVSVEAIFLSVFVRISQDRMMGAAARQSDLDLQFHLLAEHGLTRLVKLNDAVATKMGVDMVARDELSEIEKTYCQWRCSMASRAPSTRERLDAIADVQPPDPASQLPPLVHIV